MRHRLNSGTQPGSFDSSPAKLHVRKQQLVRDVIWDAAIDLFAEKGFDETTVEHIAEAAGVSQRSFFRYFPSKAALMASGTEALGNALRDVIETCPADYSLFQVMHEAVRRVARQAAGYPRIEKIIQISATYPAAREAQMSRRAETQALVAQAYARRIPSSRKADITPKVLAAITMSLFDVTLQSWIETGRRDIDKNVDDVFRTTQHFLA